MNTFMIMLKSISLVIGCVYGFSNIGKLFYKQQIGGLQIWMMCLGIVGFIMIHFWLGF